MINIALVDDDRAVTEQMSKHLARFAAENGVELNTESFDNAVDFLEQEHRFSAVFMDIEMPCFDGMSASQKLREADKDILLVFVTNSPHYAIEGYSVDAVDYILKPVQYSRLSSITKKLLRMMNQLGTESVIIKQHGVSRKILLSRIKYVEIREHLLFYYTEDGRIETWGTLKEVESGLGRFAFARCNYNTIINMRYVKGFGKSSVELTDGTVIAVSRNRKKEIMEKLNKYMGR